MFNSKSANVFNYIKLKPSSNRERSDIQLLRGIAIIGVIFNHAGLNLAGGFIGVDIFFVVSGFLIAEIIKKQYRSNGTIILSDFYVRRLLRLIPALVFVSAVVCVSMILLNNPSGAQQNSAKTALTTSLFIGNYIILQGQNNYFANNTFYNPLMHYWTLSVEWQFYIIFSLSAFFYVKYIKVRISKLSIVFMLTVFLGTYVYTFLSLTTTNSDYFTIRFRIWEFLVGSFCSLLKKYDFSKRHLVLAFRMIAYCILVLCMFLIDKYSKLPGPVLIMPVLATFILIYSGDNKIAYKSYFLKILVHIGNVSYPVYLWHWPILILIQYLFPNISAKILLYLIAVYVLSLLTNKFIEEPFRNYNGTIKAKYLFVTKIITFNLVLSLLVGLLSSEILYKYVAQDRIKTQISGDIYNFDEIDRLTLNECVLYDQLIQYTKKCLQAEKLLRTSGDDRNILVIGDSHAKHLLSGLVQTYPMANVIYIGTDNLHKVAPADDYFFKELINSIEGQDLVIVSSFWDQFGVNQTLSSFLNVLSQNNKRVYLNFGTPKFSFSAFRCKFGVSLFISNKLCENLETYSVSMRAQKDLINATANISKVYPLFSNKAFCGNGYCSMSQNQKIYFYDSNHLNALGSTYLIRYFQSNYNNFGWKDVK